LQIEALLLKMNPQRKSISSFGMRNWHRRTNLKPKIKPGIKPGLTENSWWLPDVSFLR